MTTVAAQADLLLHFGLGDYSQPLRLEVLWPNGKLQAVENVELDRSMTVRFGDLP